MTILKAHFDGKYLVPDEPVDLPKDVPLDVQVQISDETKQKKNRRLGLNRGVVTYISPDFDEPMPDEFWLSGK